MVVGAHVHAAGVQLLGNIQKRRRYKKANAEAEVYNVLIRVMFCTYNLCVKVKSSTYSPYIIHNRESTKKSVKIVKEATTTGHGRHRTHPYTKKPYNPTELCFTGQGKV